MIEKLIHCWYPTQQTVKFQTHGITCIDIYWYSILAVEPIKLPKQISKMFTAHKQEMDKFLR